MLFFHLIWNRENLFPSLDLNFTNLYCMWYHVIVDKNKILTELENKERILLINLALYVRVELIAHKLLHSFKNRDFNWNCYFNYFWKYLKLYKIIYVCKINSTLCFYASKRLPHTLWSISSFLQLNPSLQVEHQGRKMDQNFLDDL